jgi:predicted DsbA family dithiol-disulfide isomerase
MHGALFGNAPARDDSGLIALVQKIGVDTAKFTQCLQSGRHATAIKTSVERMEQLGISGTPMTVIGITPGPGQPMKVVKYIYGARPFADFKTAIDSVLAQ